MRKIFFYKNVKVIKIDKCVLTALGSKKNALALLLLLMSMKKNKVAIEEVKNIYFGDEHKKFQFAKSSLYKAIEDLENLKLILLQKEEIFFLKKPFSFGKKEFFAIFNKTLLKQIGFVTANQLTFILNINFLVSKKPKINLPEKLDKKCEFELMKQSAKDFSECLIKPKAQIATMTTKFLKMLSYHQVKKFFKNHFLFDILKNAFNISLSWTKNVFGETKKISDWLKNKRIPLKAKFCFQTLQIITKIT